MHFSTNGRVRSTRWYLVSVLVAWRDVDFAVDAFGSPVLGIVPLQRRTTAPTIQIVKADSTNTTNDQISSKEGFRQCKYDLGLGKNPPLVPSSASEDESTPEIDDTYKAVRFFVDFEAARTYPAPQANCNAAVDALIGGCPSQPQSGPTDSKSKEKHQTTLSASPNQRKIHRRDVKVRPRRTLEDCLTILDQEVTTIIPPVRGLEGTNNTMVSLPDTPQLDMNSVWVEMLLHNELMLAGGNNHHA